MKKIYNIIFVLTLFMMFTLNVKANSYKCIYEVSQGSKFGSFENDRYGGFIIENDTIREIADKKLPFQKAPEILDIILNEKETEKTIIQRLDGHCPENVYICVSTKDTAGSEGFVVLKTDLIDNISSSNQTVLDGLGLDRKHCYPGEYNEKRSTAPSKEFKWACDKYDELMKILQRNACKDDSKCDSEKTKQYNETKSELKNFCRLHLENGNSFDDCVKNCLNLSKDISVIEGTKYENDSCSFSDNLIGFISNIFKWIKYLVPALIIILSILDFIKAIGADKDEEMKKAQQKFIKRLIIAILIFIIPFIIEFVLDKMGFSYKDCGIL